MKKYLVAALALLLAGYAAGGMPEVEPVEEKARLRVYAENGELAVEHQRYKATVDDAGRLTFYAKSGDGNFVSALARFSLRDIAVMVPDVLTLTKARDGDPETVLVAEESETALRVEAAFRLRRPEYDLDLAITISYVFSAGDDNVKIRAEVVNRARNPVAVKRITYTALPPISANAARAANKNGTVVERRFFNAHDGPALFGKMDRPLEYGSTAGGWSVLLAADRVSPSFAYISINSGAPYHQIYLYYDADVVPGEPGPDGKALLTPDRPAAMGLSLRAEQAK